MTRPSVSRGARGQSLVEFALVIPLLLFIVFGIVDFGRAIYAYNTLSESARQADRTAIVDQTVATIQDRAFLSAPTLSLQPANVNVCFYVADTTQTECGATPVVADHCIEISCLAMVTTTTTFTPITPGISAIVGAIDLSSTSVGPIEFVCPTASNPTCP